VTQIFGFAAVAQAADRAASQRGPDPVDPDAPVEACPDLEREYESFMSDPITVYCGIGSEMASAVTRHHVARHRCQGWGRA